MECNAYLCLVQAGIETNIISTIVDEVNRTIGRMASISFNARLFLLKIGGLLTCIDFCSYICTDES